MSFEISNSTINIMEHIRDTDKTTKDFLDLISNIKLANKEQLKTIIEQENKDIIKEFKKRSKFDKYLGYRYITQKIMK